MELPKNMLTFKSNLVNVLNDYNNLEEAYKQQQKEIEELKKTIEQKDEALKSYKVSVKVLNEEVDKNKKIISSMEDGEGVCEFVDQFIQKDKENVDELVKEKEEYRVEAEKYKKLFIRSIKNVCHSNEQTLETFVDSFSTKQLIGKSIDIRFDMESLQEYVEYLRNKLNLGSHQPRINTIMTLVWGKGYIWKSFRGNSIGKMCDYTCCILDEGEDDGNDIRFTFTNVH
jgi:chromosome segregation ATPase|tara:strand:- start:1125 stop:1808 length:684 start_codon:yes stop_codon:yes gene_type:complete